MFRTYWMTQLYWEVNCSLFHKFQEHFSKTSMMFYTKFGSMKSRLLIANIIMMTFNIYHMPENCSRHFNKRTNLILSTTLCSRYYYCPILQITKRQSDREVKVTTLVKYRARISNQLAWLPEFSSGPNTQQDERLASFTSSFIKWPFEAEWTKILQQRMGSFWVSISHLCDTDLNLKNSTEEPMDRNRHRK